MVTWPMLKSLRFAAIRSNGVSNTLQLSIATRQGEQGAGNIEDPRRYMGNPGRASLEVANNASILLSTRPSSFEYEGNRKLAAPSEDMHSGRAWIHASPGAPSDMNGSGCSSLATTDRRATSWSLATKRRVQHQDRGEITTPRMLEPLSANADDSSLLRLLF